jgi:hypothetical protein
MAWVDQEMIMRKTVSSRIGAWLTGVIAAVVTLAAACASTDRRREAVPPATASLTSSRPTQNGERTRVSRNRATLERYYSALRHKNADELRGAIEEGFGPDAVLRISDSLPYGGRHAGREVILTMLMGFVTTTTPIIRPEQIKIESMVEEGDTIVAKAVFPWLAPGAREPIPMSAFEWFTFRDGRVSEMVVSYWDTAACLAAMKAAAAKP